MAYAVGSAANGGVMYSDGTIKYPGSSATNSNFANYQPTNATPANTPYIPGGTPAPQQPAPTNNSNTGGGPVLDLSNKAKLDDYYRSMGYPGANEYEAAQQAKREAEQQLNSGYDEYYRSLDSQMAGLGGQRQGLEQSATNTYNQGLNTANQQFSSSQAQLDSNRQKTLRDLSGNLTQAFQAGNAYLGARGANDSSAAGQYAYALTKAGNQQRGDVQSQYDQNMFNLKNTFDTETKNLELEKNNQLQQISQWYAEAQNSFAGQKGQAALQKSQQALSIAMQMMQQVQQQAATKATALTQWATNNAKSFQQLNGNLSQIGAFTANANPPQAQAAPIAEAFTPTGYGVTRQTEKDIFGNPKS